MNAFANATKSAFYKDEYCLNPIELSDFLSQNFPPRTNLLDPWLPSQGLVMLYAYRGIGKTFFGLSVAYAVATGGEFLNYKATSPSGVLYIDGEMPASTMQERLSSIVNSSKIDFAENFTLLTPDLQPEGMPKLDTVEGQAAIDDILTDNHKLIVVDNISTLTSARENEADGWTPVQAWALKMRASGRSVMFVHHAGKGGAQRGTSRREDVLDTVIALRRPDSYTPSQGAVFEVHFEKARGIHGDEVKTLKASLNKNNDSSIFWDYDSVEDSTFEKVVSYLNEGLSQKEITSELTVNKSTVSRYATKAKDMGLIKNSAKN